ncbi:hypothetical protein ACFOWB_15630 [Chenggangzhangella methanolivorans]|uniref:hypothetical protein n=1 Tax=Chenggangzhangella methanolivorans TaxID=1437009 RepID=UPI003611E455
MATWSASGFPDGSPSEGVGRFFEGGEPAAKITRLENEAQVSFARTTEIAGGRAIVGWSRSTAPTSLIGRFVEPNGTLGKPKLAFDVAGASSRPILYPFEDGVIAVAFRTVFGSQVEVVGQIYDGDGKTRGGVIVLMEASATPSYNTLPIDLSNGEFALLNCFPPTGLSVCDVTAQRFNEKGKKVGKPKVLARGAENQSLMAVALDGAGFLLALEEYDADRVSRIVYRRFNSKFKAAGASAQTKWISGQRRGPMKRLANGDVAALVSVNDGDLFVQTLKP